MLTTVEVAKRLNTTADNVGVWCHRQRFPNARKIARDWLIPDTDLEDFVKHDGPGRPPKKKDDEPGAPAPKSSSKKK